MNPLIAFLQRPDVPAVVSTAMVLAGLRVSQPTLSRLTRSAGDQLLRIGKARATRYALTRVIGRAGRRWPLYRIGAAGRPQALGVLHALARSMWWWSPDTEVAEGAFRHGEFVSGLYPGWPWFPDDLRLQGFLGRAHARRLAPALGVPDDPRLWRINFDDPEHSRREPRSGVRRQAVVRPPGTQSRLCRAWPRKPCAPWLVLRRRGNELAHHRVLHCHQSSSQRRPQSVLDPLLAAP